MAVSKQPAQSVRQADYYRLHRGRVIWATIGLQILLTGILFGCLALFSKINMIVLLVNVMLPVVVLQAFGFIVILRYALEPLGLLTRVVTHVSKEANDVTPPNLNGTYHERTGLKALVDTIYGLAVNGPEVAPSTSDSRANSLQEVLLSSMPCGVIALSEKREILFANEAAPTNVTSESKKVIELVFNIDDTLDDWLTKVEANELSANRLWTRVQNILPDEPNRKLYDVFASYHKNGKGGIETTLICFDRTEHYGKDEEDMDFIALAAHELRGPITVIRGYLDVLGQELAPTLQPDQKELLARLEVSASRLSGYVSNIMNVSRYDRRHLKVHLREDKLDEIYATIADDLALRASTQNRLLSTAIPADLPTIAADRNSLTEVMANLIDNAIKYSNEGGQVEVTATVDGDFVSFNVQDHGIGIPSSVLGSLFTKFYRSHRSRQTVAGTGLGLYISKGIVESHGGHMNLSSVEGQGSLFGFSVPIYSTVAEKLLSANSENQGIIEGNNGWIKNHSMYKG